MPSFLVMIWSKGWEWGSAEELSTWPLLNNQGTQFLPFHVTDKLPGGIIYGVFVGHLCHDHEEDDL